MTAEPPLAPRDPLRRAATALVGLACAAPLVTGWGWMLYPQTTARVAFLRLVALACLPVLVALLVRSAREGGGGVRRWIAERPVPAALAFWAAVLGLTTALSSDVALSLWDGQERQFGVLSAACCAVIAATAVAGLRERRDWRPVAGVFLAVGAAVGLHALAERAGWVTQMDAFPRRVSALFGNPTFLAGYALFVVFLVGLALVRARSRLVRAVCAVVVFWAVLAVVLTESRASVAALLLGGVVGGAAYAVSREAGPRLRRGVGATVLVTVVLVGGLWVARDQPFVRSLPAARRLSGLSFESTAVKRRLHLWNTAIEAGIDRPIAGWGPRTYTRQFDRRFPSELYIADPGHPWADRAHCEPANAFAEQGVLGLLAYLGLLGAPVWLLWRRYEREETDVHAVAAGFGLTTAVFVHGLFAFDSMETFAVLLLFGAFVQADRTPDPAASAGGTGAARRTAGRAAGKLLAVSAGLASLVLVIPLVVWPVRGAMLAADAHTAVMHHAPPDWPADVAERLRAAVDAPNPGGTSGLIVLGRALVARSADAERLGRGADARRLLDRISETYRHLHETNPADVRVLVAWASVLEVRGVLFGPTEETGDLLDALRRAQALCPTRPDLPMAAANLALIAGRKEEAIELADRAVDVEPFASDSIWRAAHLFARAGQLPRAQSLIGQAEQAGIRFEGEGLRVVTALKEARLRK